MDEFKESTKINIEKQSCQEIIDFLGLSGAPNLAGLQYNFNFRGEIRPWWLEKKEGEISDALRKKYNESGKLVDPVTILQSELEKNPKNSIEEVELIYPRLVLYKHDLKKIPPSAEMIKEAATYLYKIGFRPFEAIRGENWVLKGKSLPKNEPEKSFPTNFENIEVKVVRDSSGKAEIVSLCVSKEK